MAAAYVVTVPASIVHTSVNGHNAVVVYAATSADAIAMAKAQYDGDNDAAWTNATVTELAAGDLSEYALRIRVLAATADPDADPSAEVVYDITVDASDASAIAATGVLTLTPGAIADDVVQVGNLYYKFAADPTAGTPTGAVGSPFLVDVGVDDEASLANLLAAVNASGTPGTTYSEEIVAENPLVEATASDATTVDFEARTAGFAGNAIATTVTVAGGDDGLDFAASTLTGGQDAFGGFDSIGAAAVVAIEAVGGADLTPSYNASTNVLTVAAIADDIGDHRLVVDLYDASKNEAVNIPGLLGTIVDEGIAGAVLTVAFGADSYTLPSEPVQLSTMTE